MLIPPSLHPGDRIGVVATGRKISEQQMEVAFQLFSSWGLTAVAGGNLFSNEHNYLAGTDAQRLADIQAMVNDPTISAIICARGGYGTTRILDQIDFSALREHPKWITGFSDVTALHLKLAGLGIRSIHGAMPALFNNPEAAPSIESLRTALFGTAATITLGQSPFNKPGDAEGILIGGNLSLLVDSLGTSSEPDTNGRILVIEEIGEYIYKVDRMINQLKRAGKLDKLAGLMIGYMTDIKENPGLSFEESVEQIVLHHTKDYTYPVAFCFPSGHENPNLAWVQGGRVSMRVAKEEASVSPIV